MKKIKLEILVFLLFILTRIPSLGHDNFNTDVWKWKSRSYDFTTGIFSLDFDKTIQKYHPGVTLMWLGGTGVKIYNLYIQLSSSDSNSIRNVFLLDTIQKLLVVIAIGVTVALIFYALKNLFGLKYAILSITILSLEPFYVGLSRVFHLEGLMTTFMLASIVYLFWYLQKPARKIFLITSALFGALSLLTKMSSLYLVPFVFLTTFLWSGGIKKPMAGVLATSKWVLMCGVFAFMFWPGLWVQPGKALGAVYEGIFAVGVEGDHLQYYFGKLVSDPGPFYYFVVFLFRSTPYLILGLIGLLATYKRIENYKQKFILFLFIFAAFYFLELTISSKKLDRYLIPTLSSLILISAFFFEWLFNAIKLKPLIKYLLFILFPVYTLLYLHPDYFSYYNPMFGGLRRGIFVLEPKWLIGNKELTAYFKDKILAGEFVPFYNESMEEILYGRQYKTALSVGFAEKYYTQVHPFFSEFGGLAVIKELTPFAKRTAYFVYPVWDDNSSLERRFHIEFEGSVKIRGVAVYNVYKRVNR